MIAVNQIAYLGIFIINRGDPLMSSLNNLVYANGINNLLGNSSQQGSPSRIYFSGSFSSFSSNLNLMLLLVILPPVAGLIFYIIHQKSTTLRIFAGKFWKLAIGEWMMTGFLFIMYNYSSSLIGFCMFTRTFNLHFYLSIFEIVFLTTVLGGLIYFHIKKDKKWMGEYKEKFNWTAFSGNYYLFPIVQRLLIGVIITAVNMSFASAIISITILFTSIIILAVKKPFV